MFSNVISDIDCRQWSQDEGRGPEDQMPPPPDLDTARCEACSLCYAGQCESDQLKFLLGGGVTMPISHVTCRVTMYMSCICDMQMQFIHL